MSATPQISVIMAVHDSGDSLERTLDSVLGQAGVELELIAIDDGSTDHGGRILEDRAASDPRLRVLQQANAGLTASLARGCAQARGEFIARQDAGGDVSFPDRLQIALARLRERPEATMVSCGCRFVDAGDQPLFDVTLDDATLDAGLHTLSIPGIRGPAHHGGTMFRREAYERCGGYREAFPVAQDMDLWLRLVELGPCLAIPEILYQARYELGSISSRFNDRQFEFGAIAIECARARRAGRPEPPLPPTGAWARLDRAPDEGEAARLHYFLGSCLRALDSRRAREHFLEAVRVRPTHWRAWLRAMETYLR